jgi:hypothetical protein
MLGIKTGTKFVKTICMTVGVLLLCQLSAPVKAADAEGSIHSEESTGFSDEGNISMNFTGNVLTRERDPTVVSDSELHMISHNPEAFFEKISNKGLFITPDQLYFGIVQFYSVDRRLALIKLFGPKIKGGWRKDDVKHIGQVFYYEEQRIQALEALAQFIKPRLSGPEVDGRNRSTQLLKEYQQNLVILS